MKPTKEEVRSVAGQLLGIIDNGPTLFRHRYRGIVPNPDGTAPGRILIETDSKVRARAAINEYWDKK